MLEDYKRQILSKSESNIESSDFYTFRKQGRMSNESGTLGFLTELDCSYNFQGSE